MSKRKQRTRRPVASAAHKKKENGSRFFILLILIGILFLGGVYFYAQSRNKKPEPQFQKHGELTFYRADSTKIKKIDIEIAATTATRMQGLMYRSSMDEDKGMLFIFEKPEVQSFWMRNTIISLDIMFADENGRIVTIYENTTPYSEESLPASKPGIYVIETVAGFAEKYGVTEGAYFEHIKN